MPIFKQDLDRRLARRESADGVEVKVDPVSTVSSEMSSSDQLHRNRLQSHGHGHGDSLLSRKVSEESIRTELCEGPIPDSPLVHTPKDNNASLTACTDRADLIERLKRGESPTWIPNRHVRKLINFLCVVACFVPCLVTRRASSDY
jgi:hypothetical protein